MEREKTEQKQPVAASLRLCFLLYRRSYSLQAMTNAIMN